MTDGSASLNGSAAFRTQAKPFVYVGEELPVRN
jgi:hypothetical protein